MKLLNRINDISFKRRVAIAVAAFLHIGVTLCIFTIGRFGLFSQQFDRDGIGHFAKDSIVFRDEAQDLVGMLLHDGLVPWLKAPAELHVKGYSLSLAFFGRLLGTNILAVEPLNLLYYLAMLALTFKLTKKLASARAAWLATTIVGVWPSLLLHSTQLLRDPLFIVALLALVLILTGLITVTYNWARSMIAGLTAFGAAVLLWMTRSDMWLVLRTIMVCAIVLLIVRMLRDRRLLLPNLSGIALLLVLTSFSFQAVQRIEQTTGVSTGVSANEVDDLPLWARIAVRRHHFISGYADSGSMIDTDVAFSGPADIVKYIPRALAIGYLAPFPEMWFKSGRNVGLSGRLITGIETSITYLIEVLASILIWRKRRDLSIWFLVMTTALGAIATGLVVVNMGTLYRMRFGFWVLLAILGSAGLCELLSFSCEPKIIAGRD